MSNYEINRSLHEIKVDRDRDSERDEEWTNAALLIEVKGWYYVIRLRDGAPGTCSYIMH